MRSLALSAIVGAGLFLGDGAFAQSGAPAGRTVYDQAPATRAVARRNSDEAVFARGGYVFASQDGDVDAPIFGVGYRRDLARFGDDRLAAEIDFIGVRERESAGDALGNEISASLFIFAPLAGLRYAFNAAGAISPYASAGLGPGFLFASAQALGVEVSDSDVVFAYSGRAGVEFELGRRWGVDAGYRYLGLTDDGAAGLHAVEVGLAYEF